MSLDAPPPEDRAVSRLEEVGNRAALISRLDDIADTIWDAIKGVKSGKLKPAQGNSIALLCSTLIKAMEAARGNTPAVHVTAQLSRDEIEEILHGRDPFRTVIDATPTTSEPAATDNRAATHRPHDPLSPTDGPL